MKISIITVCYNSAATLEQTIQSVQQQSHTNTEYIIIDGASTDGTAEIIEKYRPFFTHIVSEKDKGIYDAMNKGLALATGDVISILNSDDLYHDSQVLSRVVEAFGEPIDCLATDVEIFAGHPAHVKRYYSCKKWKPWMFFIGNQPPHPGFFVRKSCYDIVGNFDTQFRLAADFDMLLRLIQKHKFKIAYQAWVSVSMRSGGASQSSFKNMARANAEIHRSLKKNGYFSAGVQVWLKYPIKVFQLFHKK